MDRHRSGNLRMLQKLKVIIFPAAFVVLNIFFFGPFNIYKGNISEFSVSLPSIFGFYLIPALILLLVLVSIGLMLPVNSHRRYVALVFVIGVLIWLQGNILVWKYGVLDGQTFIWTKDQWRGWVDGALWAAFLIVGGLSYQHIYKIAKLCSAMLICLQLTSLVYMSLQQIDIWSLKTSISPAKLPPKELYQLSSSKNVIHVILDQFQSDIFEEIVDTNPDFYSNELEGFTFFRQTTGSFPTTYLSVPMILSGKNYKNNVPISKFMTAVFNGKTIPNVLFERGYEVDIAHALPTYKKGAYSTNYHIPVPYGLTQGQYVKSSGAFLLDLVLFRSAPHYIKKFIYGNEQWLFQRMLFTKTNLLKGGGKSGNVKLAMRYFAHASFLDALIDNVEVSRNKPVYKFFHLIMSHGPFVVNSDCEYAGKVLPYTRENIKTQQKCTLDHFLKFLDKLRTMGVYQSSLLIVSGDHGAGIDVRMTGNYANTQKESITLNKIAGAALPLMLIKPPNSRGLLNFSDAPAMLSDIPATLSSMLDLDEEFPGLSIFQIDQNKIRERKFFMYNWRNENWNEDFVDRMDEYIIVGNAFDRASWKKGLSYFPPEFNGYEIQKIDFGTSEATKFRRSGWGGDEDSASGNYTFNWGLGEAASIFLSLPKDNPVSLTANVGSYGSNKPQEITVKVDGSIIGKMKTGPKSALLSLFLHIIEFQRGRKGLLQFGLNP